jgi:hypothetical protein
MSFLTRADNQFRERSGQRRVDDEVNPSARTAMQIFDFCKDFCRLCGLAGTQAFAMTSDL